MDSVECPRCGAIVEVPSEQWSETCGCGELVYVPLEGEEPGDTDQDMADHEGWGL